ncbi:MAG: hypothetical protein ACRCT8_18165 [Lacipirellulaceae bacterium]
MPGRPGDGDYLGMNRPNRPSRPTRPMGPGGAVTLPAEIPNRPGRPTRPLNPNLPGRPNRPGFPGGGVVTLPGRPVGPSRPSRPDWGNGSWGNGNWGGGNWGNGNWGNNGIYRPPTWIGGNNTWNNVNNNWTNIVVRPGNGLGNWLDNHPTRVARWGYWGSQVRHNWHAGSYAHNWYGNNWWQSHGHNVGGWHYHHCNHNHGWNYWWVAPVYADFRSWFTFPTNMPVWQQPIYYDYGPGGNAYYRGNRFYVNNQVVGSAEDLAASAAMLATVAPPASQQEAEASEWKPLGTFAVVADKNEVQPTRSVQLAVNRDGIVAGTFYNSETDEARTVQGRVDPETQRVALRVGESDRFVLETGLYNLTQDEAPVLAHFGPDQHEYWLLVRLEYTGEGYPE